MLAELCMHCWEEEEVLFLGIFVCNALFVTAKRRL